MSESPDPSAVDRRHRLFCVIVEAARKAGASEALAVCFVRQLMGDKRIRIVLKQEQGKETTADE
jgi:hypothetical protein